MRYLHDTSRLTFIRDENSAEVRVYRTNQSPSKVPYIPLEFFADAYEIEPQADYQEFVSSCQQYVADYRIADKKFVRIPVGEVTFFKATSEEADFYSMEVPELIQSALEVFTDPDANRSASRLVERYKERGTLSHKQKKLLAFLLDVMAKTQRKTS